MVTRDDFFAFLESSIGIKPDEPIATAFGNIYDLLSKGDLEHEFDPDSYPETHSRNGFGDAHRGILEDIEKVRNSLDLANVEGAKLDLYIASIAVGRGPLSEREKAIAAHHFELGLHYGTVKGLLWDDLRNRAASARVKQGKGGSRSWWKDNHGDLIRSKLDEYVDKKAAGNRSASQSRLRDCIGEAAGRAPGKNTITEWLENLRDRKDPFLYE